MTNNPLQIAKNAITEIYRKSPSVDYGLVNLRRDCEKALQEIANAEKESKDMKDGGGEGLAEKLNNRIDYDLNRHPNWTPSSIFRGEPEECEKGKQWLKEVKDAGGIEKYRKSLAETHTIDISFDQDPTYSNLEGADRISLDPVAICDEVAREQCGCGLKLNYGVTGGDVFVICEKHRNVCKSEAQKCYNCELLKDATPVSVDTKCPYCGKIFHGTDRVKEEKCEGASTCHNKISSDRDEEREFRKELLDTIGKFFISIKQFPDKHVEEGYALDIDDLRKRFCS